MFENAREIIGYCSRLDIHFDHPLSSEEINSNYERLSMTLSNLLDENKINYAHYLVHQNKLDYAKEYLLENYKNINKILDPNPLLLPGSFYNDENKNISENKINEMFVYRVEENEVVITKYIGKLLKVFIPRKMAGITVKKIGDKAFYDNSNIINVYIPNSIESIGDSAFYGTSSLTVLTFEEGSQLKTIGDFSFYNSSLNSINIPSSVEVSVNLHSKVVH